MSTGPGKYGYLADQAMQQSEASLVAVIILNGKDGHGFAVRTDNPALVMGLPTLLRGMADEIEADNKRGAQ